MPMAAPAPVAARDHVISVALVVAESLGSLGPIDLLARGRDGLQDPSVARGSLRDKIPAAMSLALVKPLRLLTVIDGGPACVAELPFTQVRAAANQLLLLLDDGHAGDPLGASLADWVARADLRAWLIDDAGWRRRREQSNRLAQVVDPSEAAGRCTGRLVAAARTVTISSGPLDGSTGAQLILDDGSSVILPCDDNTPGRVTGTTVAPAGAYGSRWFFQRHAQSPDVIAPVATGVVWQPSPLHV
jgi:hypothetical protein